MKAVRLHSYGAGAALVYEDAPVPEVGRDEILIQVAAAGVNPIDMDVLSGFMGQDLPLTTGWDVSGTVSAVGDGTDSPFAPGDEVLAMLAISRNGAYAQYALAKSAEVARKPARLDHVHASGLPMVGLTAWQLIEQAGVDGRHRVLVLGANGGVGSLAVQLAKVRGSWVVGVASAEVHDYVRALGADEVGAAPADIERDSIDLVIDTVGGTQQAASWPALRSSGRLLSIKDEPTESRPAGHSGSGGIVYVEPAGDQLTRLAELVDGGRIVVPIEATYSLAEFADAHERLGRRGRRGKLVLEVPG